ncbi:hypothetical protein [Nannocystis pusilla]|uniref:hypothetical protein n=1 Tax=Nannocystis pusilla TaxID=889268 RepID=UPI003B7C7B50
MKQPAAYGQLYTEVWSEASGPFLPIVDASKWPDQCMGSRYSRGPLPIGEALRQLRARQVWALKYSPVAVAACSRMDAAFVGDEALADQLFASRAILLKHSARYELSLDDVRDDEPAVPGLPGGTWRQQLEAAGVTAGPKHHPTGISVSLGKGSSPLPEAGFVPTPADPWDPAPPPRVGRKPKPGSGKGGGVPCSPRRWSGWSRAQW